MAQHPLILGFDTSGPWIGAVLLRGEQVLSDYSQDMARGQGEHLFAILEDVLRKGGATWRDLNAIGVGIGPGNFTGIRISVSAARGLALSLDIPAVGVSLLEAVAHGTDRPVLSCLAAPRGQAYVQGVGTKADIPHHLVEIAEIPTSWAEPELTCLGSAGQEVSQLLGCATGPAAFAPASAVARIAATRWQTPQDAPAPLYLKAADAAPSRDAPPVILDDA